MVQLYNIAGRQIASHWLAIATLSTIGAITFASTGGSSSAKKAAAQGPPINAQSPDEETFIKEFLKNADGGDQTGKIAEAVKEAKR